MGGMSEWILTWGPRIRRGVLLAVVVVMPIFILPKVLWDPFNVPKVALLIAGTAVVAGVKMAEVAAGAPAMTAIRGWVPAALFCFPVTFGWLFTDHRYWSLFGLYPRFLGLVPYVLFAVFGLLLADAFSRDSRPLAWALLTSGAIVGFYSVMQVLWIDPFVWSIEASNFHVRRAASTLGNPNFAGAFLAIVFPVGLGLALWDRGRRDVAWVLTALVGFGVVVAFSQGPWLAGTAGTAVVAGVAGTTRWRSAVATGAVVAAICGAIAIGAVASTLASDAAAQTLGPTVQARGWFWQNAIEMVLERPLTGWGPNVFAAEGVRFRPPEQSAVTTSIAEDPHNLILSHAATAGIFGGAAAILLLSWLLIKARSAVQAADPARVGFAGAAVAYVVQGFVSIDEPSIRLAAWATIGGLLTAGAPALAQAAPVRQRVGVAAATMVLALVLVGATLAWSYRFLRADADVLTGYRAAQNNQPDSTIAHFERALSFRDDYDYRLLYGTKIGELGTRRGEAGAPYIEKMRSVFSYLEQFPQIVGYVRQARLLFAWGEKVDPSATQEALTLFERARTLDPESPNLAVETSDVLRALNRERDALVLLEQFEERAPSFSAYYGALALVHVELGDSSTGRAYAAAALEIDQDDVRAKLALQELAESGT